MVRKASGAVAYISYTGTTSTTFTGCTSNWAGASGFTLNTGDVVFSGAQTFNSTTINCLANNYGGIGYYIDWNYSSCEWLFARANGSNSGKPGSSSGLQHGFIVYGSLLKFNMCHPYYNAGYGMKIGDAHTFTAANIDVLGGEYETNTDGGIIIRENIGPVYVIGANFYGNGLSGAGTDIYLSFNSRDTYISNCVFKKGSLGSLGKQIYAQASTYGVIDSCHFEYAAAVQNVFLDGSGGNSISYFTVRNCRVKNQNSGSRAVFLSSDVTNCLVSNNNTDAAFQENTSGASPNNNVFRGNVLVSGQGATITMVGTGSRAYDNKGFSGTKSALLSLGGAGVDTLGGALTTFDGSGTARNTLDDGSGNLKATTVSAAGITGATAASRYVGATASGAPASGTFVLGDFVVDQTGAIWVCALAGTPGTWVNTSAASQASGYMPPSMHGMAALNMDPALAGGTSQPTANTHYVFKVVAEASQNVSKVFLGVQTGGTTVANTYVALYTQAGNLIAGSGSTSDQSASLNASGFNAFLNLGAATAVTAGTVYYISLFFASATASPTLIRSTNGFDNNFNLASGTGSATSPRFGTAANAWTVGSPYTAPATLGTISSQNIAYLLGLG